MFHRIPRRIQERMRYLERLEPYAPEPLTRKSRYIKLRGATESIPKAVFELAENPPGTPRKVVSVPQAAGLAWNVVELNEVKPLYEGDFQAAMAGPRRDAAMMRQVFIAEWFTLPNVMKRTGFESALEQPIPTP